jgi:DNA-binding NtrC family response regulator
MILESMFVNFVEPIVACGPVDRFELPSPDAGGTVIIYHVDALTAEQQLRLIEWLEQNRGRAQVVSTTAHAILPRLQAGLFSDTLYYRLNTIRLNASSEPDRFN